MALLGSDPVALTQKGAYEAVEEHCEIEANSRARTKTVLSLRDVFCHLMAVGEASADELQTFFRPVDQLPDADRGRYTELEVGDWWSDIAAPNLRRLPGVSAAVDEDTAGETWMFDGIPPEDAAEFTDDEHMVALDDLREAPPIQAERVLDDRDVERRGVPRKKRDDDRAIIMALYTYLYNSGDSSRNEVIAAIPEAFLPQSWDPADRFDELEDHLAALPGVEVEHDGPRAPEEIPIETMQDVFDARRELDTEPVEKWRSTLDSLPPTGDIETSVRSAPREVRP